MCVCMCLSVCASTSMSAPFAASDTGGPFMCDALGEKELEWRRGREPALAH